MVANSNSKEGLEEVMGYKGVPDSYKDRVNAAKAVNPDAEKLIKGNLEHPSNVLDGSYKKEISDVEARTAKKQILEGIRQYKTKISEMMKTIADEGRKVSYLNGEKLKAYISEKIGQVQDMASQMGGLENKLVPVAPGVDQKVGAVAKDLYQNTALGKPKYATR